MSKRSRWYVPDPDADIAGYLEMCRTLERRRRVEDRALFREFLSVSVTRASPILLDLAPGTFDLDVALSRLTMPKRLSRSSRRGRGGSTGKRAKSGLTERVAPGFETRHSRIGVILRDANDPGGRLGISVEYGCLNVEVGFGPHVLRTWGGEGEFFLDGLLPETLGIGCIGRSLDALVHADVLADRGYEILTITQSPTERVTRIEFRADAVPFQIS